jgi:hypothetical protein
MEGYDDFLHELKGRIRDAQTRATVCINSETVRLYWQSMRARQGSSRRAICATTTLGAIERQTDAP